MKKTYEAPVMEEVAVLSAAIMETSTNVAFDNDNEWSFGDLGLTL